MYRKIRDYVLYHNSKDRQLREQAELAYCWIFDTGEAAEVWRGTLLSFADLCDILDLSSPEEMRAKIRRLRKDDLLQRVKACELAEVTAPDAGDDPGDD